MASDPFLGYVFERMNKANGQVPQVLTAKPVVEQRIPFLKEKVANFKERGITPCLAVVLVGDHGPSQRYVGLKQKQCEKIGAEFRLIHLPDSIEPSRFVEEIEKVANAADIHGALIQLPLPSQLQTLPIERMIPPEKDVDGFHPLNAFELYAGHTDALSLLPCTPKGILTLLDHYGFSLEGKRCLVLGRSLIVGRPLSQLLLQRHATVTMAHSKSVDLESSYTQSDFIFSAMGKPWSLLPKQFASDRAQVVIDIGTTVENSKIKGDLHADHFKNLPADSKISWTPVPGGVGPMTVLSLLENLLITVERNERKMEQMF